MALHRKRDVSNPAAARMLLESADPVELPPAEIDETGVTIERETFREHLPELLDALEDGGWADPAPIVQSDSIFIVDGDTRSFWVRLWHTDESRTHIAKLHVLNCHPHAPNITINISG